MRAVLWTVGHGTATVDEFVARVAPVGIGRVVDVRRYPGSRRHPHFAREAMQEWLPAHGVGYRGDRRLGGRRRPDPDSPNVGLRNEQFRAYADWMDDAEFRTALDELVAETEHARVAVMCAESLWWRCHRRLIADAATLLRGVEVHHILPNGTEAPHVVTDGAVLIGEQLAYR